MKKLQGDCVFWLVLLTGAAQLLLVCGEGSPAVQCPELPSILNGSIEYVGDALSTMATYMCNDSFYLNGDNNRNCTIGEARTSIGMWTGQEPQCVPIECPSLQPITNGVVIYAPDTTPDYDLGTVATYACNAGFVLYLSLGGCEIRICVDDNGLDAVGVFDRQAPICIRK
ncbi:sushi, von Willebrand factor type A, EGF and pentraxin domain-containing protein 1-like [Halichondria panicea]|uniref:sushi, von Willebrand factor type A, EGF and pentraxin domain-containing protein 1-like n=1 Tax=Halichondria panicea TaxID=6063 RepID=UPI00312B3F37